MFNKDLGFVKTRRRAIITGHGITFLEKSPWEDFSLPNLCNNKNILIQKHDSGNSVVIVDKTDYLDKIEKVVMRHVNLKQ